MKSIICTDNSLKFDARTKRHVTALSEITDEVIVLHKDVSDESYIMDLSNVKYLYSHSDFSGGNFTQRIRNGLRRYGLLKEVTKACPNLLRNDYSSERNLNCYNRYLSLVMKGRRWDDIRNRKAEYMDDTTAFSFVLTFLIRVLDACSLVEDINADVIVCNDIDSLLCGVMMKKKFGTRLIYDIQDVTCDISPDTFPQMYSNFLTIFEKEMVKYADVVIGVGNYILEWSKLHYNITVPCVPIYSCMESKEEVEPKNYSNDGSIKLYYHGTAFKERNLESVVRALKQVDGFELIIRSDKNDYLNKIEKLSKNIGVADRVTFVETVTTDELISASNRDGDIGIYSTNCSTSVNWRSSFTNKFVEWLCSGLPIITTDAVDQASIVRKYNCGYVLAGSDEYAIADVLRQIKCNVNELSEMSKQALWVSKNIIGWTKFKGVFESVIKGDDTVIEANKLQDSNDYPSNWKREDDVNFAIGGLFWKISMIV